MRRPIIAANWKMHKTPSDTKLFIETLLSNSLPKKAELIICPPFTSLAIANESLKNSPVRLGAQNMYHEPRGAFTGEISIEMIQACGAEYVIIGHSERRAIFGETHHLLNQKLAAAFSAGLIPIFCIGETLEERESGQTEAVLKTQISLGLQNLESFIKTQNFIVAYEPVWAIGTGKVATPEMAQDTHFYIRSLLSDIVGKDRAAQITIQYGGSVKPDNVESLLSQPDIDGALVGGASLDAESFLQLGIKAEEVSNHD